jgi:hypothetical protein
MTGSGNSAKCLVRSQARINDGQMLTIVGHVFATVFQLGGQMQSSRFASTMLTGSETLVQDALKAAVGASFGAQYASGSAKYTKETQKTTHQAQQTVLDLSNLAWSARGGNTLLCAKYDKFFQN